ncbi:protein-L-isoaspartate O-methyltransferase [Sphingomonas sp.]|uniref:protein-L-isoaspartate O-methyltransferase family protein n=1 Tax=Sphingomonas sp. TaxID=28214 RepID=UPI0035C7AFB9
MTATILRSVDLDAMRTAMVASQLRPSGVTDPRVVAAMAEVARERFVPAGMEELAYRDTAIDLGQGRRANTPLATARLLVEARLRASDRVLLIGAAMGYTAAVLARIVAEVVAVESTPALAAAARANLADLPNVTVIEGALEQGHAAAAPYDVLVIDGAVEQVPATLYTQLVERGRAVTGLNDRGVARLAAGARDADVLGLLPFADYYSVPLPGFGKPRSFTF